MVQVCAINWVRDIDENMNNIFWQILSDDRKNKVQKYRCTIDKIHCIYSEILLKYMLWKYCKLPSDNLEYKYNTYGKPYLKMYPEILFSISPSNDWIICALADTQVGIDVEEKIYEIDGLAERFYSKEEYEYVDSLCDLTKYDEFIKIWTLKESYIKCIGKGMSIPLNLFGFKCSQDEIKLYRNGICDETYMFYSQKLDDMYHMSICVENEKYNSEIILVSKSELLSAYRDNK